jgi:hypothetical protein
MEKYYNNVNDRNHFVKKENIKPKKKKITDLEDGVREQIEDIESEMTLADKKIKVKNLRKVYSTGFKTNRIALSKVTFSL